MPKRRGKRKYVVSGYLTISVAKYIEADSEAEARAIAETLASPSLCHQCSGAGDESPHTWRLNGFDDPPDDAVQNIEDVTED